MSEQQVETTVESGHDDDTSGRTEHRLMYRWYDGNVKEAQRCICNNVACSQLARRKADLDADEITNWIESRTLPEWTVVADTVTIQVT